MDPDGPTQRISPPNWIVVAVIGVLIAAMLVLGSATGGGGATMSQCDGSVPRWMLPDDYRQLGGCVPLRPAREAWFPWNWGRQDLVCIGMCADSLTPAH